MRVFFSPLACRAARLAAACLLLAAAALAGQAPEGSSDAEAQASFLYHLGLFVEWPDAEARARAPFTICTIGKTPAGPALRRYAGQVIHGRPLDVREVHETRTGDALSGCEIAFIAERETPRLRTTLAPLAGQPIVTVGEADGFLQAGGMLRIGSEEGRLRFDVELGPAERAGIKFSSRLLALAATVTRDGHPVER